jgi:hypothetical protein
MSRSTWGNRCMTAGASAAMASLRHDLVSPSIITLKGGLFLIAGLLASTILIADVLTHSAGWRTLVMHALAVWCFARAYYFAFYVVQHYIDASYRFAGLVSVIRWLSARRARDR